jgi:general secretion pathway protein M
MLSNLSTRERLTLGIGGAVAFLLLLIFGLIAPYRDSLDRLDARIDSRRQQLAEIQQLKLEYQAMQRQAGEVEAQLARSSGFSLFSFVESAAGQIAGKESLTYMRPQPGSTQDGVREESVEIRVEKVRLEQVVRLLHAVESADALVRVKSLRLKNRFDDKTRLDAVLTISAFGRAS